MTASLVFLWPIADFLNGRKGQDHTKEILAEWWIRFDEFKWNDFGQQEAKFAINILESWFW